MAKLMIDIYDIYYKKNQNEEYRIFVLQNDEMYVPGFNSRDGFILEKSDYNINFNPNSPKQNKVRMLLSSIEIQFIVFKNIFYICTIINKDFFYTVSIGNPLTSSVIFMKLF